METGHMEHRFARGAWVGAVFFAALAGFGGCTNESTDHPGAGGARTGAGTGATGTTTGKGTGTTGSSTGAGGSTGMPPGLGTTLTLHRLNRVEYNNTVRDLVGTALTPADDFAEDELGSKPGASFDNLADNLGPTPSVPRISQYLTAAKAVMKDTFDNPERKQRLLFCDATQDGCVDRILTTFAERAWRRPVGAAELAPLKSLVKLATDSGDDVPSGIKLAMTMVLTSPYFVNRVE